MAKEIFISYSRKDFDTVKSIKDEIDHELGIDCWMDVNGIESGDKFKNVIIKAINNHDTVLFMLSNHSMQSEWALDELDFAKRKGKRIVIVYIEPCEMTDDFYFTYHKYDTIEWHDSIQHSKLVEDLHEWFLNGIRPHEQENNADGQKQTNFNVSTPHNDEFKQSTYHSTNKQHKELIDFDYEEGVALLEAGESKEAFRAFLHAAKNGNADAQNYLYKILADNCRTVDFIDKETSDEIKELSDSGIAFADLLMHYKYYGMGNCDKLAMKYLNRAKANRVSPYVYLQLGICYGWGLDVKVNHALQMHYYQKAYDEGCIDAASYIGQEYMTGNSKFPVDYDKSEAILKEGIEKGDARSWKQLIQLYYRINKPEKVKELIDRMIREKQEGAYSEMGYYYYYGAPCEQRDCETAKEWYRHAIQHNEKKAWGELATIYVGEGNTKEAMLTAQKGCSINDSLSYLIMGYLYEQEGPSQDFSKAWNYYMQQQQKFGVSADSLANLYLNHRYLPENYALDELKNLLDTDAKRHDESSLICLLQIILEEHNKPREINYENIADVPETFKYLELAVSFTSKEASIRQLRYLCGRLMLDTSKPLYNPYQAMDILENEAKEGNKEAVSYLLKVYSDTSEKKKLSQLVSKILATDTYLLEGIEIILNNLPDDVPSDKLDNWISGAIDHLIQNNKEGSNITDICHLYKKKLNNLFISSQNIPYEDIRAIQDLISTHREECRITGCLPLLKEHAYLIHPDFDPEDILKGDFFQEEWVQLLFEYNRVPLKQMHVYTTEALEKKFYDTIISSIGEQSKKICHPVFSEFFKEYSYLVDVFSKLEAAGNTLPINGNIYPDIERFHTYCTTQTALDYALCGLKMVIAAQKYFGDEWQNITSNLDSDDELLNIAERLKSYDAQNLLALYVSVLIELDSVIFTNNAIRTAIYKNDKATLKETFDNWIEYLDSNNILHNLTKDDVDTLSNSLLEAH